MKERTMFAKRLILALAALAVVLPLAGCRHRCCKSNSVSSAPPCCPAPGGALPPPGVLPPSGF
jgi:hypothetical protein